MKKPTVLIVLAIIAVILTVQGVRPLRKSTQNLASDSPSQELRARVSGRAQANYASSDHSNYNSTESASTDNSDQTLNDNVSSTSSQISADADSAAPPAVTALSATAGATKPAAASATPTEDPALQVTFAWAEASREWLQAMGASTPGLHRVPDLDAKLRESVGGYRILEVTRQRLTDKVATTTLIHGDRLSIRFESTAANDSTLTGSIQPSMRGTDGSVRSPAAAAVSIDKGQGSIVTLGAGATPTAAAPSSNPTGAEIILLILPRWGANRNP